MKSKFQLRKYSFFVTNNVYSLFFVCIMLLLVSCTNQLDKQEAALKEDIHRIHDVETMPKMGYMLKLSKELTPMTLDTTRISERAEQTIIDLGEADEEMMDWMAQFSWQDEKPQAERITYYTQEVEKLERLKKTMFSAIENAERILEK